MDDGYAEEMAVRVSQKSSEDEHWQDSEKKASSQYAWSFSSKMLKTPQI